MLRLQSYEEYQQLLEEAKKQHFVLEGIQCIPEDQMKDALMLLSEREIEIIRKTVEEAIKNLYE